MNIYGKCEFKPTKAMEAEFDKGIEKINSSYGFHMVHIFSKDVICGEMDVRKAYFEGFGDAECYAYEYDEAHKDNKRSYVICIDKEVYRARLFGDDTDIFKGMAGDRKGITDYEKGQVDLTAAARLRADIGKSTGLALRSSAKAK